MTRPPKARQQAETNPRNPRLKFLDDLANLEVLDYSNYSYELTNWFFGVKNCNMQEKRLINKGGALRAPPFTGVFLAGCNS